MWSRLGLGAKPLELNVPAHGMTRTEAARLTARAETALRERQLLVAADPAPSIAGRLNVLAKPEAQVDVRWARGGGTPELRGLVAMRGKTAVLALWDGERVGLRGVKRDLAADELVRELGAAPAGAGRSVTTPADVVVRASRHGDVERFQRGLVAGGVSRDDARVWRDVMTAPRLRAGQLGASGFDRWGKAARVPWVIHVLDTERGRYATYERGGYRTLVGVDTSQLVRLVRELYADAVRDRRNW